MQGKLDNSLEANRKAMDNMYLDEVIKLPEKIDHIHMLTSIAKLNFKLVIVSSIIFRFFVLHEVLKM